ncbi:MAG: thioredoxin family protein [Bacteroidales bacterium]
MNYLAYLLRKGKTFILFLSLLTIYSGSLFGQILEPVKWSYSTKIINDSVAELIFTATIDDKWHIYSQEVPPDGPRPTLFMFDKAGTYSLIGKASEPHAEEAYDEQMEMNLKFFSDKAVFKQKVKMLSNKPFTITGEVECQVCDDKSCILDVKSFSFSLPGSKKAKTQALVADATTTEADVESDTAAVAEQDAETDEAQLDVHEEYTADAFTGENKSLWWFFAQSFAWGLLAILTPCVFPMIPMTVSFFMKSGGKLQATVYGISIILIYVIFGVLVAVLFGADFGNWLSTHWIPNILFFLIFVIFAASFFGYFEIRMPSKLVNKSVAAEEKGGIIGTIFMALTLVLVSFSCTGPIVGVVVVQAVGGQIIKPIVGMLGFSLAFAIPFTLLAYFPSWLEKLPKSGGWLNTVKVVIGFIELAFAIKFLSVPDLTYHWGILDREIYIGLWIVIFTMMGFYLLGKIKFPHDSDYPVIKSFPRLMLIIATFAFVVYLIPGLWGAPLKGISGWLPPMETQDFDISTIVRENSGSGGSTISYNITEEPLYSKNTKFKLPHGLKGYFDLEQALRVSKELNKPLFVDFTGFGCTNCREMENRVWSDPKVLKRLRENFVIVALYVDDKSIEMPESEWYTNEDGRLIKLLGKKNAEIQIKQFGSNAQPYYLILDSDRTLMVEPRAYNLNINEFIDFLDRGAENYNKRHN